jgi:hypothetical protein
MAQPLVCTVRDQKRLQRAFELLLADTLDPKRGAELMCSHFRDVIRAYPADWSMALRRPSEHAWTFGRATVRYRIVPHAEAVEIVSVEGSNAREAAP